MGVDFARLIDPYVQQVVLIGFKLKPGTPVRDQAGIKGFTAVFILLIFEINAGGPHDLVNDHPLGAIDDEGAPFGHQGQFADEDFLLLDFAGFLIDQATGHIHLGSKGGIAPLRFFDVMAGPLQPVLATDEVQLQLAGVIGDRREAFQLLDQPLLQEPFEACPLHLNQIGEVRNGLGDLDRAAHALTCRNCKVGKR